MTLSTALVLICKTPRTMQTVLFFMTRAGAGVFAGIAMAVVYRGSRPDVYNILWAVVFGFATLNILSLAAKRFEPTRRGLSFGELLAVMVVLLSIFLLAVEMFNMLHIFPIKLQR